MGWTRVEHELKHALNVKWRVLIGWFLWPSHWAGHGFGAQPRYWDGSNPKSSRTSGYQFQGHFILIHTDISDVWTWAAKIYQSLRNRHVDLTAPYDSRTPFCLHEWTRLKICDAGIGHMQKFTVSKIILTSNQEICSGCSGAWVALILQLEQTCVWKHSIRWTSAGLAKAGHFVPFPVAGQGSGILKLLLFKKSRRSAVVANYKRGDRLYHLIPPLWKSGMAYHCSTNMSLNFDKSFSPTGPISTFHPGRPQDAAMWHPVTTERRRTLLEKRCEVHTGWSKIGI